jgi:parallel beta-helix repeat protein
MEEKLMRKKIVGIFVCMLLIATLAIPISALNKDDILDIKLISKSEDVPTWEVGIIENNNGESHPRSGGYIQGLIDNASVGDTIYIPSGIYYENIIINKSISLIGEDKNTTIIDGGGIGHVVDIRANWVNISGFTIKNSGQYHSGIFSGEWGRFFHHIIISDNKIINNIGGIHLNSCCCNIIEKNIISNNYGSGNYYGYGIQLDYLSYGNIIDGNTIESNKGNGILIVGSRANKISGNTIESNNKGLRLHWGPHHKEAKNNEIFSNIISNNVDGIELIEGCYDNTIAYNIITSNKENGIHFVSCNSGIENNSILNNGRGIYIETSECTITYNTISNNDLGIYLKGGNSFIQKNNLLNNTIHARFKNYLDFSIRNSPHIKYLGENNWEQNYWGEEKESPKIIYGVIGIRLEYILGYIGGRIGFPWINIDWHPAKEPYDIQVGI